MNKKLLNRVRSIINQSKLTSENKALRPYMVDCLEDYILHTEMTCMNFSKIFPDIVSVLLSHDKYVYGIGNLSEVMKAARSIALQEHVVCRVVLGGSERIPWRALSYLVPALEMLRSLALLNPNFRMEVLIMEHTAVTLNNLSLQKVQDMSTSFEKRAQVFISKNFCEIADRVTFMRDSPLFAQNLIRIEEQTIHTILSKKPDLTKTLEVKMEKYKHVLRYIYAHHLVHNEVVIPHISTDMNKSVGLINIGGKQEEFFYSARLALGEILSVRENPIFNAQIFTRHHTPPYYAMPDEGLLSSDFSLSTVLSKTAQHDLKLLENYQI